jgi:hypothetical protein
LLRSELAVRKEDESQQRVVEERSGFNGASREARAAASGRANKGHDTRAIQGWLGHPSSTGSVVYTALAPNRFKDFWRE